MVVEVVLMAGDVGGALGGSADQSVADGSGPAVAADGWAGRVHDDQVECERQVGGCRGGWRSTLDDDDALGAVSDAQVDPGPGGHLGGGDTVGGGQKTPAINQPARRRLAPMTYG